MPEVNIADGDVVTGADFDSIDDQLIITCTSSTRPTGVEGRHIYETDTNKRYVYDGTSWNIDGGSGWVSFTPSFSGLTLGNGAVLGMYRYIDGGMWVQAQFTMGSTSSMTGPLTLALPNSETMKTSPLVPRWFGGVEFNDSGTPYYGQVSYSSGTALGIGAWNSAGTYLALTALSSTVPFTWATGDFLVVAAFVPL
jgi:hypothetical protein